MQDILERIPSADCEHYPIQDWVKSEEQQDNWRPKSIHQTPEVRFDLSFSYARSSVDENMLKWRQELEHFEQVKSTLWKDKKLRHKFVAVHNKEVVDFDADKFALARRMSKKLPDQVVLIMRVQREIRIIEMPSPELG